MLLQQLEAPIKLREATETQEIHFKKSQVFKVIFVPLNDRSIRHGAVFDGHNVVHGLMAQQKSAGMNREVARKIENLVGKLYELFINSLRGVKAHLSKRSRI